jgi:serine phosphatase RsbU (regulator of sigma subunit)
LNGDTRNIPARRPTILVVDDEPVVTQSLSTLLELETDCNVLTFQSPLEALEVLQGTAVDVVICDFMMPEMNGLEFLLESKRRHPDAPRIMLTGYADKENSIRAINDVGLFQYLEKPWDNDQLLLVVSNAITNKGLRETLRQRVDDLDHVLRDRELLIERDELLREELDIARRLQLGMLPAEFPVIDGMALHAHYLPALEIGGDFYDVIPLADGKWGILVADVTGHGIQAALSTAVVKFAFSDFKNCGFSPTDIVTGMNDVLLRALPEETFAAAMVLSIDEQNAQCHFANAGLPHPFLLRREARQVERIAANGFMLGAVGSDLFAPDEEKTVRLSRGDFLMVCTDGIGEVRNAEGELFEHSAITEQLIMNADHSGSDLANAVIEASRAFSHPGHQWDDITVLGIDLK